MKNNVDSFMLDAEARRYGPGQERALTILTESGVSLAVRIGDRIVSALSAISL